MIDYSDVRYLRSKRSVDDRALNRGVLEAFQSSMVARQAPPKVLEIGAGVGTMVSRFGQWQVIEQAEFTLLDRDEPSLAAAREHLSGWAEKLVDAEDRLELARGDYRASVQFVLAEAFSYLTDSRRRGSFDAVIANAVLDLMDLKPALEHVWQVLKPGGLFWFSINFDGETIFLPELPLDAQVMRLYHRTMDERVRDGRPAGDSKTGRHLLTGIRDTGAELLAAGSSDWVVFPRGGAYPEDEAYFLHHIVRTIAVALADHPEIDQRAFEAWIDKRHAQVERAELYYIAHQLDVFGTAPGAG